MPYLETVQELLDDGTSLSTNLVLSWNELRTNLRGSLRLTCNLTRKVGIQVVGGIRIWEYKLPRNMLRLRSTKAISATSAELLPLRV